MPQLLLLMLVLVLVLTSCSHSQVFAECMAKAPAHALFTTNTLGITIADLRAAIRRRQGAADPHTAGSSSAAAAAAGGASAGKEEQEQDPTLRLLGLRFLWPVTHVPLVEVTFEAVDARAADGPLDRVCALMEKLEKTVFECPSEAAQAMPPQDGEGFMRWGLNCRRLRLNPSESQRHCRREARRRLLSGGAATEQEESCVVHIWIPAVTSSSRISAVNPAATAGVPRG